jgi:hypothetical protein
MIIIEIGMEGGCKLNSFYLILVLTPIRPKRDPG